MRRLIISLGILVGMVVAAAFIVPAFIDLNRYKGEIQSQVQKITGQPLELKGGIRLRLLPAPFIKIEGLVFGRTPDGRAIAQIEALSLSAELLPLLKKRLVIQAVDLQKPHVDIVGVQNVLAQMGASSAKTQATKVPMEGQMAASGSTQGADFQLQIQSATLKDGTFVYKKGQATHTLSKVMVKASLGGVQGPLNIDTQGEWNGIPVDVDVAADKLWGDMPINVRATLAGARMKFRGTANIDTQSASGTLNLALPEEMTKPAAVHVGQLRQGASVLAQVEATAEHLQIINAELDMGSVRARGAVDITLGDKVGVRGQFSNLPGGGVLQLSTAAGQDPMVIDLSLKAAKVAEFLKGMEISAPRLPQELAAGSLAIKAGLRLLDGAIDVPTLHVQAGQASLNGSLRVKTAKQPTQVEFKFTTTTPQALAALAGQSFPSGFTTLGASGAVTLGEATQLNVDLKAESLSAKIQGSIGPDDQHNLNVGLTHPDAASLVAKFGVTPSPIKGAVLAATQVAGSA
ncbi:MAG: AsmA family protein, partial [Holosporales bacterium]